MLHYLVLDRPEADLDAIADDGLTLPGGEPASLWTSLDRAPTQDGRADDPVVLVVEADALDAPPKRATPERLIVDRVPAHAIQNLAPYRPPKVVRAGGGYVARALEDDVAVLLIHRKGVWDIPKGKQDPGEDVRTCAAREVREEVGIDAVDVLRGLGTTVHGYRNGDVYAVKETHWYLMQTDARTFEPEEREGIRRVAWARWDVARRHLGYETLQKHMDRIEADVRETIQDAG